MHSDFSDLCQRSNLPFHCGYPVEVRTCVIPEIRINSLKSRAMNCGPLSEMIRGLASGYFSLARSRISPMSACFIDSRKSHPRLAPLQEMPPHDGHLLFRAVMLRFLSHTF